MSTPHADSIQPTAIDPILDAYRAGQQTLLVSGRSLFDLHLNEHGQMRPLRHTLMRRTREEFGMATLLFNLALGARWNWEGFDASQRRAYEAKLELARLPIQDEVKNDSRGREPLERACNFLKAVQQTIEVGSDIPPIHVLIEFGEDIIPHSDSGTANDWILQMSELLALIGSDYLRRRQQAGRPRYPEKEAPPAQNRVFTHHFESRPAPGRQDGVKSKRDIRESPA